MCHTAFYRRQKSAAVDSKISHILQPQKAIWPRGYKDFFHFHALFFLLIDVKMPTIVGILTYMSGKNGILGLSEPNNAAFLDSFILMRI